MRIAHISDPHLLSFDGARLRDFLSKRWIGGLNLVTNRAREHSAEVFDALVDDLNAAGVDHVVCTGDVTNVALPGEFRFARERFDRIAAGPRDTTVIPGNHDAYVDAGVSLFAELFGDFCASDPGWDHGDWPLVRVRGPVAIVGVTTALQTPWFTAWGRVGDDQLARLRGVLSDPRLAGRFRIVAIHHPPAGRYARHRRHGLRDGDAFCAVLAELGADLVLHGHEHRDLRADIPRPDGAPIPVLGVRSATYAGRRASHRAGYTIYAVGRPGQAPAIERRVLAADGTSFEVATH